MGKITAEVQISDVDHIYVDGKQYISLRRFFENKSEIAKEYQLLAEQNESLLEENKHLKALLKERL